MTIILDMSSREVEFRDEPVNQAYPEEVLSSGWNPDLYRLRLRLPGGASDPGSQPERPVHVMAQDVAAFLARMYLRT